MDGFFDVEDLFVRPSVRGHGLGRRLTQLLLARAERPGLPVRFWVPRVDTAGGNLSAFARTTRPLGLRFRDAPVRWASYLLTR